MHHYFYIISLKIITCDQICYALPGFINKKRSRYVYLARNNYQTFIGKEKKLASGWIKKQLKKKKNNIQQIKVCLNKKKNKVEE